MVTNVSEDDTESISAELHPEYGAETFLKTVGDHKTA
jgi:hypothetical protein